MYTKIENVVYRAYGIGPKDELESAYGSLISIKVRSKNSRGAWGSLLVFCNRPPSMSSYGHASYGSLSLRLDEVFLCRMCRYAPTQSPNWRRASSSEMLSAA
jgi:hypothetical protein